ncbi:MAG TPA: non-heme iron oxygenase ferredoxin subunit [Acidimicrobiales bacterium]|nr:non-heme iron oxygenase ferredoxin subunit [Acidimicrobiales bacterium]
MSAARPEGAEVARVALDALVDGQATRLEGGEAGICVVRLGDRVYAIGDRCSHANVSLAEGEVDPDERTVECWKHGSAFSLLDGEPQSLPAVSPVPVYDAEVVDGQVVVHARVEEQR